MSAGSDNDLPIFCFFSHISPPLLSPLLLLSQYPLKAQSPHYATHQELSFLIYIITLKIERYKITYLSIEG